MREAGGEWAALSIPKNQGIKGSASLPNIYLFIRPSFQSEIYKNSDRKHGLVNLQKTLIRNAETRGSSNIQKEMVRIFI